MRDWSDEPYVKLYTRDNADWHAMPWQAKTVLLLMLKGRCDRAGFLDLGRRGLAALGPLLGLPPEVADAGVRYLLDVDGCLRIVQKGDRAWLFWPNYVPAQSAAASDKVRQAQKRERARAEILALELGVTLSGNAGAVTEEPSRPDVTPSASRSDQTRSDQKDPFAAAAAEPPVDDQDQDQDQAADPEPVAPKPKRERKLSTAEEAYRFFLEERGKKSDLRDQKPPIAELNATMRPILDEVGLPGFKAIARAYLADTGYPAQQIPPWPWRLLLKQWGSYRAKAAARPAAAASGPFQLVDANADPYRD